LRYIAHRGNVDGINESLENTKDYIDRAISLGYDVEIDLRVKEGKLFLGHDEPQYPVTIDWLIDRRNSLGFTQKTMSLFLFYPKQTFNTSITRVNLIQLPAMAIYGLMILKIR